MEFERVYLLGLDRGALRWGAERAAWIPDDLAPRGLPARRATSPTRCGPAAPTSR